MEKEKNKWWFLLVSLFLIVLILTAVFWDTILLYALPQVVLREALSNAIDQLNVRFQGSPLLIVGKTWNAEGRYAADVILDTESSMLGNVHYDVRGQIDLANNQIQAHGTATVSGKKLDISAYLDRDIFAVTSDGLVKGQYYGIAYDTFAEDIRRIPLLSLFVQDTVFQQWEASVLALQAQMAWEYTIPRLPDIMEADVENLLLGILAMPCRAETATCWMDSGRQCRKITCTASGSQVKELLSAWMDTGNSVNASISASFYLYENSLIQTELNAVAGENCLDISLMLMEDASQGPAELHIFQAENGEIYSFFAEVQTSRGDNSYAESWEISFENEKKTKGPLTFSYRYIQDSGKMELMIGEDRQTFLLTLQQTDTGFRVHTEQLRGIVNAVTENVPRSESASEISCSMTVGKGEKIFAPEYKKLDRWSMEDLLNLLGGVGALLGLRIS